MNESDPTGRGAHEPGAKLDAGKPRVGLVLGDFAQALLEVAKVGTRVGLVLGDFAQALLEVAKVGTHGASKYTDSGWVEVPGGIGRYTDAMLRHYLAEASGERIDDGSELLHAAHVAWNALARLELMIRQGSGHPADMH